jgi:hypothetical protein
MAYAVQLAGADAGHNMGLDHFQNFGSKSACHTHPGDIVRAFDGYGHLKVCFRGCARKWGILGERIRR